MTVQAGALDTPIRLQRRASGTNPSGSERREWEEIGTEWAALLPVSGRESFAAQQRYAEVDTRFVIRFRNDVTPLHRILVGEKPYDVREVLALPGGRPDRLEILATARAE